MAKALVVGILSLPVFACSNHDYGAPEFTLEMCKRIAVSSSIDGELIIGAEDIVPDMKNRELIFSAYDRRAVEKAVAQNVELIPQGNVYRVLFDDLFNSQLGNVVAFPLLDHSSFSGGIRPHGLSFDSENRSLAFINRTYPDTKKTRKKISEIVTITLEPHSDNVARSKAPCAANDIIHSAGGPAVVTFDHQSCGFDGFLEELFNKDLTGVWRNDDVVLEGLKFANGIAAVEQSNVIAIAATRSNEIVFAEWMADGLVIRHRVKTPGGPDNISRNKAGDFIVAVHPSMLKLALQRKLGFGRAPSRIIKIDPDTKKVTMLFNDKAGEKIAAATVGVDVEGHLVIGSVLDTGLLVCAEDVSQ